MHKTDEVWVLQGGVVIQQGAMTAQCRAATLWFERGRYGERRNEMTVYLEGRVTVTQTQAGGPLRLEDSSWYGKLESTRGIELRTPNPGPEPEAKPPVYINGMTRRHAYSDGVIRRTQFTAPVADPAQGAQPPPTGRRIRAFPRSSAPVQATWFPSPDGSEFVAIVDSGINLIIDGVDNFGTVDVSTDRLVIWTRGAEPDLTGQTTQRPDTPLEIYMEGNVIFRQGERVVRAQRMYYDVTNEVGVIMQAEVLTPAPNYLGLLRLKADLVQQTSRDRFVARNAFITSSLMGSPGYKLSASTIELDDNQVPQVSPFTGEVLIDPATGQAAVQHNRRCAHLQQRGVGGGSAGFLLADFRGQPGKTPVLPAPHQLRQRQYLR